MRLPCIIKLPQPTKKGGVQNALISWVDITPTLLDFAGILHNAKGLQGKSFKNIIETENAAGWDEVYASHTMHEVTMYYPMRVLREQRYKLIWNMAYQLPFPMALDLFYSYAWKDAVLNNRKYGKRTTAQFLQRPEFELYDIQTDPDEVHNLATQPAHKARLKTMQDKLRKFQEDTQDPWAVKALKTAPKTPG
jgi:N-sulfoglucosamine sulfohydrolase